MNNKTTLLDIFNNVKKPISNKLLNSKNVIQEVPFIQKYIIPYFTHKNILIGILFFVLIWLIAKWFFEYVYVNASNDFKNRQRLRKEKILNFIKSIFVFIRKSLTPFTLLIFLYITYIFKNQVSKVFKVITDLLIFLLSLININSITKVGLITIVLMILCFVGKKILDNIDIIQNQRDNVSYLVNNKKDTLKEINNIQNEMAKNDFDIKEYGIFIKKNLFDWDDIKKTCKFDNNILNEKISDIALSIPSKFKNNISVYKIRNQTANELEEIRKQKLKEKEEILKRRRERLQRLQTEITYHQIDEAKNKKIQDKIFKTQQLLLNQEKATKNALEFLKNATLVQRLRGNKVDPEAWAALHPPPTAASNTQAANAAAARALVYLK